MQIKYTHLFKGYSKNHQTTKANISQLTQRFQILPLYAFEYPSHKILPFCYSELTLAAVGESYEHLQTESALFVYLWVSMMFLDEQIKADGIFQGKNRKLLDGNG